MYFTGKGNDKNRDVRSCLHVQFPYPISVYVKTEIIFSSYFDHEYTLSKKLV